MGFRFKGPDFDEAPLVTACLLLCIILIWATGSAVIIMGALS